ncbi:hypothetical protein SDC9_180161 [bioreactor metagenome]|uniref:Uncharacterized protein n=1 Tax=bioreactor metagenome TaxID=1076179 RepID=A0A645H0V1_9ZZZZ
MRHIGDQLGLHPLVFDRIRHRVAQAFLIVKNILRKSMQPSGNLVHVQCRVQFPAADGTRRAHNAVKPFDALP